MPEVTKEIKTTSSETIPMGGVKIYKVMQQDVSHKLPSPTRPHYDRIACKPGVCIKDNSQIGVCIKGFE